MPATLPVPSKGALRALRNLALGTSCTVAAGAGLLTEDRRRRIHSAKQVYENAQKLKSFKSSKGYHSSAAIESFEEQASRHGEDAFWLPSNVAKSRSARELESEHEVESNGDHVEEAHSPQSKSATSRYLPLVPEPYIGHLGRGGLWTGQKLEQAVQRPAKIIDRPLEVQNSARRENVEIITVPRPAVPTTSTTLRELTEHDQCALASSIQQALEADQNGEGLNSALSLYTEYFNTIVRPKTVGVGKQRMNEPLSKISNELILRIWGATGPKKDKCLQIERLLVFMSQYGTFDESIIPSDVRGSTMLEMLKRVRLTPPGQTIVDEGLLDEVAEIYFMDVTRSHDGPDELSVFRAGESLCQQSVAVGRFKLTRKVFTRMERGRGDRPPRSAHYLIEANYALDRYNQVFRDFMFFYPQITTKQQPFYKIGNMVLDSLLRLDNVEGAKRFLSSATEMAKTQNLTTSTSWFLRTLGHEYRQHNDMQRTRDTFDVIAPLITSSGHPQALYAAIIQFCVESGLPSRAETYYQQLVNIYPEHAKDAQIFGHLLLSKAMQSDWEGVRQGLRTIDAHNASRSSEEQERLASTFLPVLKLYAKTHDVGDIEKFLSQAFNDCKIPISNHIFNFMVSVYGKSKQLDHLTRWVEFSISAGCKIDAATVNSFLTMLAKSWGGNFREVKRLHHRIRKLSAVAGGKLVNGETTSIIEKLALQNGGTINRSQNNTSSVRKLKSQHAVATKTSSRTEQIERDMLRKFHDGEYESVSLTYNTAQNDRVILTSNMVKMAVKALLAQDKNDIAGAQRLIQDAQKRGQKVDDSIGVMMLSWMKSLNCEVLDSEELAECLRDEIVTMMNSGIIVAQATIRHAIHLLVQRGSYSLALQFWQDISRHPNQAAARIDIVTLTSLLQIYVKLSHIDGVRWSMKMLTENKLQPDDKFHDVLRNAIAEHRSKTRMGIAIESGFHDYLPQAFKDVDTIRLKNRKEKDNMKAQALRVIQTAIEKKAVVGQTVGRPEIVNFHVHEIENSTEHESEIRSDEYDEHMVEQVPVQMVAVG